MRLFLINLFLFKATLLTAQLTRLKGTWITPESELMLIHDTASLYAGNYLATKNSQQNYLLFLYGDTLSFQEHYSTSSDNFKEVHVKKFDFQLNYLSDSMLIVKPVSDLSKGFFNNKAGLIFTRKKFSIDNTIRFEKIIFNTTSCHGSCSTYHLQINNKKEIELYAERVHKKNDDFFLDSSKMGYYIGTLDEKLYNNLISELKTCNLNSLSFNDIECCDGSVITIIVYYNGQRKYFKSMFPPIIASDLISYLHNICSGAELHKTNSAFAIEQ